MNTLTSSSSSFLHSLYSLQNPNNFTTTNLSFRYNNTSSSFTKTHTFHHHRFIKLNYKLPSSSQVSDTEEDDEDDDEEEAADEYEGVIGEFEDDDDDVDEEDENVVVVGESKSGFEEFKWQRIERIRNDVRE
ncbi:hypothetical protein Tco_0949311, partial [Tanacetum coccineum]